MKLRLPSSFSSVFFPHFIPNVEGLGIHSHVVVILLRSLRLFDLLVRFLTNLFRDLNHHLMGLLHREWILVHLFVPTPTILLFKNNFPRMPGFAVVKQPKWRKSSAGVLVRAHGPERTRQTFKPVLLVIQQAHEHLFEHAVVALH